MLLKTMRKKIIPFLAYYYFKETEEKTTRYCSRYKFTRLAAFADPHSPKHFFVRDVRNKWFRSLALTLPGLALEPMIENFYNRLISMTVCSYHVICTRFRVNADYIVA